MVNLEPEYLNNKVSTKTENADYPKKKKEETYVFALHHNMYTEIAMQSEPSNMESVIRPYEGGLRYQIC